MKLVRLINQTQGRVLCEHCEIADNLVTRIKGLLGRASLAENAGLLITPCPSVHMIGMKFAIDVLFLTRENRVTDWVENLPAGFHFYVAKPRSVDVGVQFNEPPIPAPEGGTQIGKPFAALELPAGAIARSGAQVGDEIGFESI